MFHFFCCTQSWEKSVAFWKGICVGHDSSSFHTNPNVSKYRYIFFLIEILGACESFIIKYVKEKRLVMRRLYFMSPNKLHLDEICAYTGLYKCPCIIWNVNKISLTAQTAKGRVRALCEVPKFGTKPEDVGTGLLAFCLMTHPIQHAGKGKRFGGCFSNEKPPHFHLHATCRAADVTELKPGPLQFWGKLMQWEQF